MQIKPLDGVQRLYAASIQVGIWRNWLASFKLLVVWRRKSPRPSKKRRKNVMVGPECLAAMSGIIRALSSTAGEISNKSWVDIRFHWGSQRSVRNQPVVREFEEEWLRIWSVSWWISGWVSRNGYLWWYQYVSGNFRRFFKLFDTEFGV